MSVGLPYGRSIRRAIEGHDTTVIFVAPAMKSSRTMTSDSRAMPFISVLPIALPGRL
jgi:hypothetical protein